MTTINLKSLELTEFTSKDDVLQHCRATFPLLGAHGTEKLATVYFEIEPGNRLGRHTDSEEELLVILKGSAEATIADQKSIVSEGDIVYIPKFAPHNVRNIGSVTLRVLGVFGGSNNIVATFDNEWQQLNSKVVSTADMA